MGRPMTGITNQQKGWWKADGWTYIKMERQTNRWAGIMTHKQTIDGQSGSGQADKVLGNDIDQNFKYLQTSHTFELQLKTSKHNPCQTLVIKTGLLEYFFNLHCCNQVIIFNVLPKLFSFKLDLFRNSSLFFIKDWQSLFLYEQLVGITSWNDLVTQ
jgi:hypothetical protein